MNQVGDVRVVCGGGRFERTEGVSHVGIPFEEKFFVGVFEIADVFIGEATALEADDIDAARVGRVAIDDHEGRDVLIYFGDAADDGVFADFGKLMETGHAGNDGVVFDFNMAGEAYGI